jgi:uncharacterized protein (DUF1697 family)
LKNCFKNAGFQNTMTYINSGNVIFDSEEQSITNLSNHCNDILEKKFGFPIGLALIDVYTLKEALEHVPDWWGDDPYSKHNAIFVIQPSTTEEIIADAGKVKPEYEQLYALRRLYFGQLH